MMRRVWFFSFLFALFSIFATGTCPGEEVDNAVAWKVSTPPRLSLTPEEQAWIAEHPVIRVASDPDYAPFQFKNEAGRSNGIANDFLQIISVRLGIRLEYQVPPSWADALQRLQERKADMLAVAAKTPERIRYLRFTEPYIDYPDVIITRTGQDFQSLEALSGKRLVTLDGTAINEFLMRRYPDIKLVMVPDIKSILAMASTGEVDAAVLNLATTSYAIEKWKIANLHISGQTGYSYRLALASRRDWPMLNQLLDKALATVTQEERQRIFSKWIQLAPKDTAVATAVELTDEERRWLDEHPVILAASDPDWPPIEYLDQNGEFSGIAADYIALVGKRLRTRIEVVPQGNWSQALASVREHKVSLLTAAARTPDRDRYLRFTEPYLELPAAIIINDKTRGVTNMADLRGKRVTAVRDYASYDFLKRGYPYLNVVPVADIRSGLYAVSYGEADAFIGNIASASWYIEKNAIQNLRVASDSGFTYELAIAARSDLPILQQILQKGVASISRDERQAIYRKWIGLKPSTWKPTREQLVTLAVVLVIIGIGSILFWNHLLRRKVESRTRELQEAREVAEQANSTKSNFLAAASHDLRQPLHAMSLQIGQLKELLQDESAEELLAQIGSSQRTLSDILNALLDISRLDAGMLKPNLNHFSLTQIFDRLENEFTPQARERGAELRIRPTRAWIYSDATLLYRIIANLVDNAIKHTRSPGVLVAARKRGGSKWCVEVWDCGPGIPVEKQQSIFGEFVQLDNPGRERHKGLGLGLSIVQRLTGLFDYQLTLISSSGRGSCFRLEVPQGDPLQQQNSEHLPRDGRSYSLQGAAILVVDDDPAVLNATCNILSGWKCTTLRAASMDEALEVVEGEEVDAIVADYRLADGYSGVEVIEALQEKLDKRSKALIVTGEVSPEAMEKLRSGRYPVLSKPVAPITLRSALHRLIVSER